MKIILTESQLKTVINSNKSSEYLNKIEELYNEYNNLVGCNACVKHQNIGAYFREPQGFHKQNLKSDEGSVLKIRITGLLKSKKRDIDFTVTSPNGSVEELKNRYESKDPVLWDKIKLKLKKIQNQFFYCNNIDYDNIPNRLPEIVKEINNLYGCETCLNFDSSKITINKVGRVTTNPKTKKPNVTILGSLTISVPGHNGSEIVTSQLGKDYKKDERHKVGRKVTISTKYTYDDLRKMVETNDPILMDKLRERMRQHAEEWFHCDEIVQSTPSEPISAPQTTNKPSFDKGWGELFENTTLGNLGV